MAKSPGATDFSKGYSADFEQGRWLENLKNGRVFGWTRGSADEFEVLGGSEFFGDCHWMIRAREFGVTEFNQFNPDDTISGNHGNSGYGR